MTSETFNVVSTVVLLLTFVAGIATVIVYYHQLRVMQQSLLTTQDMSRRASAFQFYDRFILDVGFRKVSQSVGETRRKWESGDHSVLQHFLIVETKPREEAEENRATPHQNLSIALHFWAAIHIHLQRGLLDADLVRALMGHLWCWNDQFFVDFVAEYQSKPQQQRHVPEPTWVRAVPALHEFFVGQKSVS